MYRIVGSDQKEYGPVTADQITDWIREGRSNGQTLARFEDGPWKPLAAFPEFAAILPPPPANPAPMAPLNAAPSMAMAPQSHLVLAVLVTTCCGCVPLGIPAIYHAAQVKAKVEAGDFAGAHESSRKARMWVIIALVGGIVFVGIYTTLIQLGYIPNQMPK